MLSYFPEVYPGELVYSAIARYQHHAGLGSTQTVNTILFDYGYQRPSFDLPDRITTLADRIPPERGLSAERLIDEHTLFPYFRAVSSPKLADEAYQALLGTGRKGWGIGLLKSVIPKPRRLRFCRSCSKDMTRVHGEPYWHREHQLSAVLVCPKHREILSESTVITGARMMHYVQAGPATCPDDAPAAVKDASVELLADLTGIASFDVTILRTGRFPGASLKNKEALRGLAGAHGLGAGRGRTDRKKLLEAVEKRFGHLAAIWPDIFSSGVKRDWLGSALREFKERKHPIAWFLIEETIKDMPSIGPGPFGKAPWACLNPLAEHYGQDVVNEVVVTRMKDREVHLFTCSCGFAYRRSIDSEGVMRGPRLRTYGPTLDEHVKRSIENGTGIADAASKAETSVTTLRSAAIRLGIDWPKLEGRTRSRKRGRFVTTSVSDGRDGG